MRLDKRLKSHGHSASSFEKQLLLAQKYNKPVVIHCVAAFQEVDKKRLKISVPMIIHGFSKK
jgi:TatD DNase family protein